ncbi:hypothetical protein [Massilia sp. Se16.2.3]|uniref:FimV/HubP-related protein n=1 Tax=Massilia sp. Se16.2.3 TaxID=2709303 RepID=UPI0016017A12|nr:hypothetical protein [Massilia sp. Se16.2.3]QNA99259.1 hypothetical protein G4G31_11025 [Massilia sp. Se16.2.3]
MATRLSLLLSSLLAASVFPAAGAHAAELGEAKVGSHIGQPLVADVELTMIDDAANPVQVRLADPNVYRGANIAMPAVLGSLNMSVMRRDGRQFLHLTSLKPVEGRHLHLYLDLADGKERQVRLVTLWLTPDPNPVPVPAPAPAAPVAAVVPAATHAAAAAPAGPAPAARKAPPNPCRTRAEKARAGTGKPRCVPRACGQTRNLRSGTRRRARQCLRRTRRKERRPATRACAPRRQDGQAAAAGRPRVGVGAGKGCHGGPGCGRTRPRGACSIKPAAPQAAPRIHAKPKKAPPPEAETSWLPIAGAVAALLALGGLVAMLVRRRRAASGKMAQQQEADSPEKGAGVSGAGSGKRNFVATVKARLMALRRHNPAQDAAQTAPESAAQPAAEAVE